MMIRAVFIWGLIAVQSWIEYTIVSLFILHLANGMKLDLPDAVAIVNFMDGLPAGIMLLFSYISKKYLGPYLAVICSTSAYISGLVLLYVGATVSQTSSVGVQLKIIYPAILLVDLGRAGFKIQLKEFLTDQCRNQTERKFYWRSAYCTGIFLSVILLKKRSWRDVCMIFAIILSMALSVFLLGFRFYNYKKPDKNTLHNILRVLYAAATKRHHTQPFRSNGTVDRWILRWLNNAAVHVEEEQVRGGRLPTMQAHIWRSLSYMIPIWMSFIPYGLLLASTNTLFYLQTFYTANYIGHIPTFTHDQSNYKCSDVLDQSSTIQVPDVVFVVVRYSTSYIVSRLYSFLLSRRYGEIIPRRAILVRIGAGIAFSPFTFFVAWVIDLHRVHQLSKYSVCLRFSWLIPQFVLLGVMEGLVFDALESLYCSVVPESLHKYARPYTEFAANWGHFVSMIFILHYHDHLIIENNYNWSTLGRFYIMMGFVGVLYVGGYSFVAWTKYRNEEQGYAGDQDMGQQPIEQLQIRPGEEPLQIRPGEEPELVGVSSEQQLQVVPF